MDRPVRRKPGTPGDSPSIATNHQQAPTARHVREDTLEPPLLSVPCEGEEVFGQAKKIWEMQSCCFRPLNFEGFVTQHWIIEVIFIVILYEIQENWKQLKKPATGRWTQKWQSGHSRRAVQPTTEVWRPKQSGCHDRERLMQTANLRTICPLRLVH
jgi:hypothetical protein